MQQSHDSPKYPPPTSVVAALLGAMTLQSKVAALLAAGYDARELGRLTGITNARVVRSWAAGGVPRKNAVAERIDDLYAIVTHLIRTTGYAVEDIVGWTRSRNSDLAWSTPLQCLADSDQFSAVLASTEHMGRPTAEILARLEETRGVVLAGRGTT